MEMKKYRLSEICYLNISSLKSNDAINVILYLDTSSITENIISGLQSFPKKDAPSRAQRKVKENTIIFSTVRPNQKHYGIIHNPQNNLIVSSGFTTLDIKNLNEFDPEFVYLTLTQPAIVDYLHTLAQNSVSSYPSINPDDIGNLYLSFPDFDTQHKIASVLSSLDSKIALNRRINAKLEQMAKRLYDYWFVQFDFPNAEGKPYKSSGGKMVWNEILKREIPEGWEVKPLNSFISSYNSGDWGSDIPSSDQTMKVRCIRGADIIEPSNLPERFIKNKNINKLLSAWDMVIEVSGGSPTQSTARSALITPGVLERNGGSVVCSNFCAAFSFKYYQVSSYFSYMWKMFYENDIMFNYEGKTSGIKNFLTDTFLANMWLVPPQNYIESFFRKIETIYAKIDYNILELAKLTTLRDKLLPMLMNGQVEVK